MAPVLLGGESRSSVLERHVHTTPCSTIRKHTTRIRIALPVEELNLRLRRAHQPDASVLMYGGYTVCTLTI